MNENGDYYLFGQPLKNRKIIILYIIKYLKIIKPSRWTSGLNKAFGRHALEEGRNVQRPKFCDHDNEDKDNSPNNIINVNIEFSVWNLRISFFINR